MRSLTVRRNKSFVGCLMKAKVYVEDLLLGDTTIGETRCRKLGDLKNGEEKTFQITEDAAKIYVIVDQVSKSYCNEFYQLDSGVDPVVLSGSFKLNPASGNGFQFDNNTNAAAIENRKRSRKRGIWVLILAAIVGGVIGFLGSSDLLKGDPEPKTFTKEGLSITLTDAFSEFETDLCDVAYESDRDAVFAIKESFDMAPGAEDLTVEEYAAFVQEANGQTEELKSENGLLYYEYDAMGDNNLEFHYTVFMYKGSDAFWIVQFATFKGKEVAARADIMEWAKSVTFVD